MQTPADLGKHKPVEHVDADPLNDVEWLQAELSGAQAGSESGLMRLLLSRVCLDNLFQFCALLDAHGTVWDVNEAALRGAGVSRGEVHGKPFWEARWWQSSSEAARQLRQAIKRAAGGEFIRFDAEILGRAGGEEIILIDFRVKPVRDRTGAVRFLVCEGLEISEQRRPAGEAAHSRSVAGLQEEERIFAAAVAAEPELVQVMTDAATEASGAAFGAFFYNVIDEKGETYTLYTLSGASRESFAQFPMPRNTLVFGPTFRGESIVRSDDITKDARYGHNAPYHGMPEGHLPVRSYLAVPVKSRQGEVLGGLFFGHPEPGVFVESTERTIAAIAVQAGIAIDKARLYRAAQQEIERRKKVEAALRESEATLEAKAARRSAELAATHARLLTEAQARASAEGQFRLLVEGVVDYAIYMLDTSGVIKSWNKGGERIKGYESAEVIGRHFSMFFTEEDRAAKLPQTALATAAREGKYDAEGWRVRKDGSRFWASVVLDALRDPQGNLVGYAKVTRDITERREAMLSLQRARDQLAQAQKMEGIGHLTGGVAHDFNNILAVIVTNLEILRQTLRKPVADADRLMRPVESAMRGAQRAASLTQRLLAFARRQPLEPKTLDVGKLINGMSDLLQRSLGEQVEIETVLTGGLWRVHADPNQLEVALLNLAVNARDAMPNGGRLTIETANAFLDEVYAANEAEVAPGQYVLISVSDTGVGMTRETAARVFEPFFTTKEVGQGTGLGLSQVYGFVKQSAGHVKIYSELGEGTTVKIYLPRIRTEENVEAATGSALAPVRGEASEVILVVEDHEDLRKSTVALLREIGYQSFEAPTGKEALETLKAHPEIRLLFTDVGLPGGMNGRELANEALRLRSDLKVLFTTGYARNAIVHNGQLDAGVHLITKPFTYSALAAKIRDILDAPGPGSAGGSQKPGEKS